MMRKSHMTGRPSHENENSSSRRSWHCPRGRNRRRNPSQRIEAAADSGGSPPLATDGVLVAARELNFGDIVDETGMRWDDRLKDHIPEGVILKSASPGGIEELKGAFAQRNFAPGDLLRRESLDKDPPFARKLASGKRAVAINIDTQGSSEAGGFIMPDNRVDVIHTFMTRTPRAKASPIPLSAKPS